MAKVHECIDCIKDPPPTVRKIWTPEGKPRRCGEHGRAMRQRTRDSGWAGRLRRVHRMTEEQYWALYEAQGRKCAIPRCRAIGKVKKLAVEHDHEYARQHCDHDPKTESCSACWRGLCCGPHNYDLLGRFAVDLEDAVRYLADPPARKVNL